MSFVLKLNSIALIIPADRIRNYILSHMLSFAPQLLPEFINNLVLFPKLPCIDGWPVFMCVSDGNPSENPLKFNLVVSLTFAPNIVMPLLNRSPPLSSLQSLYGNIWPGGHANIGHQSEEGRTEIGKLSYIQRYFFLLLG